MSAPASSAPIAAPTERALRRLGIDPALLAGRTLPFFADVDPAELVVAEIEEGGKQHRLTQPAAAAWAAMRQAAEQDGVTIVLVSAWRNLDYQSGLIQQKLDAGMRADTIFTSLAPPGCSEHHTGRAIDINTPDCDEVTGVFGETEAFRWLSLNATGFGFTLSFPPDNPWGFIYEPWHWCWNP